MRQKRGKVTTFLCSLIPGAAEMYMGFMKKGISLMAVFILCFVVPSVLRVSDVFILFAVLVWFYSFFHARNLAACKEGCIRRGIRHLLPGEVLRLQQARPGDPPER